MTPCLAHQRFTMLTTASKGLATARRFSVVPRFVVHSPVRPFTTLCGSCSQPFTCNVGTEGSGRSAVGLISTREGIQLTDGLDLLATHCVKNILWCGAPPVSCARQSQTAHTYFGWHWQRRHPRCMFPPNLKHRKSPETLCSTR